MWQLHFFWFWWGLFSTMAHVFPFNWRLEVTTSRPETSQLHIQLTLPVWQQCSSWGRLRFMLSRRSSMRVPSSEEAQRCFSTLKRSRCSCEMQDKNVWMPSPWCHGDDPPPSLLLTPILCPLYFSPSMSSLSFLLSPSSFHLFIPLSHLLFFPLLSPFFTYFLVSLLYFPPISSFNPASFHQYLVSSSLRFSPSSESSSMRRAHFKIV